MKIEYLLIKSNNDFCSSTEQFKSLLRSNKRITMDERTIRFSDVTLDYTLNAQEVAWKYKEIIFYFIVTSEKKNVTVLENFDCLLHRINENYGNQFKINTIWDDVSIHYANKLYPVMVETENMLRKLIYRFMIKTAGSAWFRSTVPESVKEAIKKNAEKNRIEVLPDVDQLYLADFIQLGWFFFEKYTMKPLNQNSIQELRSIVAEQDDKDNRLASFMETYEARSNWERFFAEKIEVDNLYKKWQDLYDYRNRVAHAKRLNEKDYTKAMKLIAELKTAFEKGLEHIDNVKMTEEQAEAVKEVAKETISFPKRKGLGPWKEKYSDVIVGLSELGLVPSGMTKQIDLDDISSSILQIADQQQKLTDTINLESGSLFPGDKLASQYRLVTDTDKLLVRPHQYTLDAVRITSDPLTTIPNYLSVNGLDSSGVIRASDIGQPLEMTKLCVEIDKLAQTKESGQK